VKSQSADVFAIKLAWWSRLPAGFRAVEHRVPAGTFVGNGRLTVLGATPKMNRPETGATGLLFLNYALANWPSAIKN
jgi:hypothetical protein